MSPQKKGRGGRYKSRVVFSQHDIYVLDACVLGQAQEGPSSEREESKDTETKAKTKLAYDNNTDVKNKQLNEINRQIWWQQEVDCPSLLWCFSFFNQSAAHSFLPHPSLPPSIPHPFLSSTRRVFLPLQSTQALHHSAPPSPPPSLLSSFIQSNSSKTPGCGSNGQHDAQSRPT